MKYLSHIADNKFYGEIGEETNVKGFYVGDIIEINLNGESRNCLVTNQYEDNAFSAMGFLGYSLKLITSIWDVRKLVDHSVITNEIIKKICNGYPSERLEVIEEKQDDKTNIVEISQDKYDELLEKEEDLEYYKTLFKEYKSGVISIRIFIDKLCQTIINDDTI